MEFPPEFSFQINRRPGAFFTRPGPDSLTLPISEGKSAAQMSYENHVYLAKLAEQAERYEGTRFHIPLSHNPH